jgi:C4-dicarboxylate transporter, DctM subunit
MNLAGLAGDLSRATLWLGAHPTLVLLTILAIYLVLGAVLESISMLMLTVPEFFLVISGLGIDAIWFGIFVVIAIEISPITPPVGLNVFVLKAVVPDVPTSTVFRGVLPFVVVDFVRILLLIAVPGLALLIPSSL